MQLCPKIQDIGAKIPLFVSYLYNTNITRVLFVPNIKILNVFQQFGKQLILLYFKHYIIYICSILQRTYCM